VSKPRVLVLDAEYKTLDRALDRIFDVFPLEVSGRDVLVKPNMLGPFAPDTHVNTNPALVRALVERLRAAGAQVTVADNPGAHGYGAVEKSGRVSGILEASLGAFSNMAAEVEQVALPGDRGTVNISGRVRAADVLISVPKFKTHIATRISGAVKNSYGFVVGGDKARFHHDLPGYREFSQMLVEVYRLKVPDLVIMDGVVGMQGNGPSSTTLYPVGKILASDNGVSLDAVMAKMMGMKPEKVAMLQYANRQGLGEIDISRIDVEGNAAPLKKFRGPVPAIPQIMPGSLIAAFYPDIDRPRFDIDAELCTSCSQCRDICPGNAITMEDKLPSYDYSNCISCYCCMEMCSQQAITVRDTLRTRIYRRLSLL
jgi:uncharacterized protein (DUF362 family)/Pyruvate/2-oxoacid:ferredoxin oxidoreductase delta subunit